MPLSWSIECASLATPKPRDPVKSMQDQPNPTLINSKSHQAIESHTAQPVVLLGQAQVVFPQPAHEVRNLGVPPHPLGEPLQGNSRMWSAENPGLCRYAQSFAMRSVCIALTLNSDRASSTDLSSERPLTHIFALNASGKSTLPWQSLMIMGLSIYGSATSARIRFPQPGEGNVNFAAAMQSLPASAHTALKPL